MNAALIGIRAILLLAYSVSDSEITSAINSVRSQYSLQSLVHSPALVEWARLNNNEQRSKEECGHYVRGQFGQVSAVVHGVPHSAREMVAIWLESPLHATEILRPNLRFGGGSVLVDGNRQWWTYNLK